METRRTNGVGDPQRIIVDLGDPTGSHDGHLAVELAAARATIAHLETALVNARIIGAAIGIVMAQKRVTYEAAFDMLAVTSQRTNRKLRAIADDLLVSGDVQLLDARRNDQPGNR